MLLNLVDSRGYSRPTPPLHIRHRIGTRVPCRTRYDERINCVPRPRTEAVLGIRQLFHLSMEHGRLTIQVLKSKSSMSYTPLDSNPHPRTRCNLMSQAIQYLTISWFDRSQARKRFLLIFMSIFQRKTFLTSKQRWLLLWLLLWFPMATLA